MSFYAPALVTSIAAGSLDINVIGQTSRDTRVLPGTTRKHADNTDHPSLALLHVRAFIRLNVGFWQTGAFFCPADQVDFT